MPKPKVKPFPVPISELFQRGIRGYSTNSLPLTLAGLATFAVLAATTFPVWGVENDDFRVLLVTTIGLIIASTTSLPWFSYALNAARNEPIDIAAPFRDWSRFIDQLVCSFWFWAAFFLGFQYLRSLFGPILFFLVLVLYSFYGFVVADRAVEGPLRALGTSVRLGEKRRIPIFAIMMLFLILNFFGAIPIGFGANPLTIALSMVTLGITMSITLVAWGCLYDILDDLLVPLPPAKRPQWGRKRAKKSRWGRKNTKKPKKKW